MDGNKIMKLTDSERKEIAKKIAEGVDRDVFHYGSKGFLIRWKLSYEKRKE